MTDNLFLLLGANLGDRLATFRQARRLIVEYVGPLQQQSGIYETAPWGVVDQPAYLNQVLRVLTMLTPEAVLQQTQAIEQELGRVRHERWGSRMIDVDLLYYGSRILQTPTLVLPHPLLHKRRFTLVPLTEIAPDFQHPVLQKTNRQLLGELDDQSDAHLVSF